MSKWKRCPECGEESKSVTDGAELCLVCIGGVEREDTPFVKSKFIDLINVLDPDTGNYIEVEIRKLETGAMIGIDGSYLEQDVGQVYSPYDKNEIIEIPDNEDKVSCHQK